MTVLTGLTMLLISAAPAPAPSPAPASPSTAAGVVPTIRCDVVANDNAMAAAVLSRLAWNSKIDAADIQIFSTDGVVTVYGLVPTAIQKEYARTIILDTYGVVHVTNQLDVIDWPPRTERRRIDMEARRVGRLGAQEQSDDQIVSALRSTLSFSRSVNTCAIDVSSLHGFVTLQGQVPDQRGFDTAVLLANETLGVRSVDATRLAH
ncbi:BON domain-containing protein [Tahibacter soli]|uniref:BON domain-containing protein n=1 Tax=Tahibacter soli TaxID=2983605 RepID=A0A9X4BLM0_9GAMM|nr:BON domain-containing protein [Tahibacter soli]MDC8014399.1 BON domain-containing protein [Tahibacter soli]